MIPGKKNISFQAEFKTVDLNFNMDKRVAVKETDKKLAQSELETNKNEEKRKLKRAKTIQRKLAKKNGSKERQKIENFLLMERRF